VLERLIIKALDHSKAAKACDWKSPELKYRKVGRDAYQTESDFWCETGIVGYAAELRMANRRLLSRTTDSGRVEIAAGFFWDGPSGRFPGIPLLQTYDTRDSMVASLVHDDGYRKGRAHKYPLELRDDIDRLFLKILLAEGMYSWRARRWYWAVRKFGLSSYTGKDEPVQVTC
jgi:hypothetical protein